jgi:hypothetical protein
LTSFTPSPLSSEMLDERVGAPSSIFLSNTLARLDLGVAPSNDPLPDASAGEYEILLLTPALRRGVLGPAGGLASMSSRPPRLDGPATRDNRFRRDDEAAVVGGTFSSPVMIKGNRAR